MMKKDENPMVKNYAYGGRVAAGSMEKPEQSAMAFMPQNAYTTQEERMAEAARKKDMMAATLKRLMG
jgi:hypothetical protein